MHKVLVASEVTGLPMLGHLARDSIEVCITLSPPQSRTHKHFVVQHSMLEESEKRRLMELWETRWEGFVKELVASNRN